MDLTKYRASQSEQLRTGDLLDLFPRRGQTALDIGARDGHFSVLLAERFNRVIALDLTKPDIEHPKVECVQGNAARLPYADGSMDFVFCAEVLEHIPPDILPGVCRELERVCGNQLLIGVPYRQDIRLGRTTCYSCLKTNPPWGHVNSFDEARLLSLFPGCAVQKTSYVGRTRDKTNALSALLMDLAGNPYGTYEQGEGCIHCGKRLLPPPPRGLGKKVFTKLGHWSRTATESFAKPRANWMHVLLVKQR